MSCAGVSASRLRLCALTGKNTVWKRIFRKLPPRAAIPSLQRLDFQQETPIYIAKMRLKTSLLGVALATATALPALATDATLIVDRGPQSVALYFKLAATDFKPVFGTGAEGLLDADGTVDVPRLYDGTFPLADEIFSATTVRLAGQPTTFEALSMMVHDPDILPDFAMPYDAELSIAVCTSPETVQNMTLETLEGYLGYFAWKVDGLAELEITLPQTGRAPLDLRVLEFVDKVEVWDQTVTLEDGATLTLTEPDRPTQSAAGWLGILALAFAALAAGLIWPRTPKPRSAT